MEMGHKNVTTTQHYLRFPMEMVKSDFPSLGIIIDEMSNVGNYTIRATKSRANEYNNIPNLKHSHRE